MESPFGGVFLSSPEGGVKSSFLLELEPLALESLAFESSELLSALESLVSEEELSVRDGDTCTGNSQFHVQSGNHKPDDYVWKLFAFRYVHSIVGKV